MRARGSDSARARGASRCFRGAAEGRVLTVKTEEGYSALELAYRNGARASEVGRATLKGSTKAMGNRPREGLEPILQLDVVALSETPA